MPFNVQDLHLHLGRTPILQGISFALPRRGITGIIGTNGCGKTTLLRALSGILPPGRGQVLHEGCDIGRLSPATGRGASPCCRRTRWPRRA